MENRKKIVYCRGMEAAEYLGPDRAYIIESLSESTANCSTILTILFWKSLAKTGNQNLHLSPHYHWYSWFKRTNNFGIDNHNKNGWSHSGWHAIHHCTCKPPSYPSRRKCYCECSIQHIVWCNYSSSIRRMNFKSPLLSPFLQVPISCHPFPPVLRIQAVKLLVPLPLLWASNLTITSLLNDSQSGAWTTSSRSWLRFCFGHQCSCSCSFWLRFLCERTEYHR